MIKVWNVQVTDYLFVNSGDVCCVKAIDIVTKSRHLYVWSPTNTGMSDLHSEEEWVQNTIQWWQKFTNTEIENFLSWFTQRPNADSLSTPTKGE